MGLECESVVIAVFIIIESISRNILVAPESSEIRKKKGRRNTIKKIENGRDSEKRVEGR